MKFLTHNEFILTYFLLDWERGRLVRIERVSARKTVAYQMARRQRHNVASGSVGGRAVRAPTMLKFL